MPKMIFECQHIDPFPPNRELAKVTYESKRENLEDVIADFQDFLKGCGFNFEGTLSIVEDNILTPNIDSGHNQYF